MSRKDFWRFPVVAIVLVGLVLGTCLTGLAQAASFTYPVCGAAKVEELSASKTSSLALWAVPVDHGILPLGLLPSRCTPLPLTPDRVSANLWEDISSRAPPTLL